MTSFAALLAGGIAGHSQPANVESRACAQWLSLGIVALFSEAESAEQPEPRQRYRDGAGSKVARTNPIGLLAITVLCGSATALVSLSPLLVTDDAAYGALAGGRRPPLVATE